MQGGPGASEFLLKRYDLLGSLLAPSPCLLFCPSSRLELRGWRGCGGACGSVPQRCGHNGERMAEPCGRAEPGAPRQSHSLPQPQLPLGPGLQRCGGHLSSASKRTDMPEDAQTWLQRSQAIPSRSHCAAGRQVGWAGRMLRHSIPALGPSGYRYPKIPRVHPKCLRRPASQRRKEARKMLIRLKEEEE